MNGESIAVRTFLATDCALLLGRCNRLALGIRGDTTKRMTTLDMKMLATQAKHSWKEHSREKEQQSTTWQREGSTEKEAQRERGEQREGSRAGAGCHVMPCTHTRSVGTAVYFHSDSSHSHPISSSKGLSLLASLTVYILYIKIKHRKGKETKDKTRHDKTRHDETILHMMYTLAR
jgi:hypothetical protein